MAKPPAKSPPETPSAPFRAVERAKSDLRRGYAVVVDGGQSGAVAVLAAEQLTPESLAALTNAAGPALMALTEKRAAVLHIKPSGHEVILLPVPEGMAAAAIRDLADPTADLDHPLRGPFQRLKGDPGPAAGAAVRLCKLAQLLPAAVIVPLDGPDVAAWADEHDLLCVSAGAIARHEGDSALAMREIAAARVPLEGAEDARIIAFRPPDGGLEHLAILIGDPAGGTADRPLLTRLHSECFTGDLLGSLRCDCGEQLRGAVREIAAAGGGVLLYLAQEGRGIGLVNKLRAYRLQDQGFDTIEANERLGFDADERVFLPAAEMLKHLGFTHVKLMTNNPEKVAGLEACGITVTERVAHAFPSNSHNEFYLATKKKRSGHYL
jgi:GTP cyclohydrolase II